MIDKAYIQNLLAFSSDFGDNNSDEIITKEVKASTFIMIGDNTSRASGLKFQLNTPQKLISLDVEVNNHGDFNFLNGIIELYVGTVGYDADPQNMLFPKSSARRFHLSTIDVLSHEKLVYKYAAVHQHPWEFYISHLFIAVRIHSWNHGEVPIEAEFFNPTSRLESVFTYLGAS